MLIKLLVLFLLYAFSCLAVLWRRQINLNSVTVELFILVYANIFGAWNNYSEHTNAEKGHGAKDSKYHHVAVNHLRSLGSSVEEIIAQENTSIEDGR